MKCFFTVSWQGKQVKCSDFRLTTRRTWPPPWKVLRKSNGKEYEPSTLTGLLWSIQRFLLDSGYTMSLCFHKKCWKSSVKTRSNASSLQRSCYLGEVLCEDKLFKNGSFSAENPIALQRTMCWILSLHFRFRACNKSCNCAGETFPCRFRIQFKMAVKCD